MKRYIALEGGDGSGKSTVAEALAELLEGLGHEVIVVREPGGTPLGEAIRLLLLDSDRLDDWAEVFLFAAQRAELTSEVIRPALDAGKWVISDRTYYSSIAYQGRGRGLGEDRIRDINEAGLGGVVPDHVFVLDVDPATALARQHDPDRIGKQGVDFQERVRASYLALGETDDKVVVLDGSRSVGELAATIVETVT
ncbi:MAG: dTMP kinase [Actinomycetota bacterium]|nr:dTMP kinase [Actinomycetota bacterium]